MGIGDMGREDVNMGMEFRDEGWGHEDGRGECRDGEYRGEEGTCGGGHLDGGYGEGGGFHGEGEGDIMWR
jgi:hypothetical protein